MVAKKRKEVEKEAKEIQTFSNSLLDESAEFEIHV
jgi:hypothetical protein